MKCCVAVLALLLLTLTSFAQPPDTLWTRSLRGTGVALRFANGISVSADSSIWVGGQEGSSGGISDAVLYHISPQGSMLDTLRLHGTQSLGVYGVAPTFDNGCIALFRREMSVFSLIKMNSAGDSDWVRTFQDVNARVAYAVVQTADSGYAVTGYQVTTGHQAFLVKTNSAGVLQWSRTCGPSENDELYAIRQTRDGGFILAGVMNFLNSPLKEVLLIRTSASGDTLWRRIYSQGTWDEGHGVCQTDDGGFLIAGWSRTMATERDGLALYKVDSTGVLQWSRLYFVGTVDRVNGLELTPDGGCVLVGSARDSSTVQSNAVVLRCNSVGDSLRACTYGGPRDDDFRAVALMGDGGLVAAGMRDRGINGGTNCFGYVVRLAAPSDVAGVIRNEHGNPVQGVYVAALNHPYYTRSDDQGRYSLFLVPGTYDLITYGPCTERDTLRGITVFPDSITAQDWTVGMTGGRVEQTSLNPIVHNHVTGYDTLRLRNDGAGTLDFSLECMPISPPTAWLSATTLSGSILPGDSLHIPVQISADTSNGGIFDYYGRIDVHMNTCPDSVHHVVVYASVLQTANPAASLPRVYRLSAYPNPFNPATEIAYDLPASAHVSLRVYDLLGRDVARLQEGKLPAGHYTALFDGSALSSGLYFVQLQTSSTTLIHKIMLLR